MTPEFFISEPHERVYILDVEETKYVTWEWIDAVHADLERVRAAAREAIEDEALAQYHEELLANGTVQRGHLRLRF